MNELDNDGILVEQHTANDGSEIKTWNSFYDEVYRRIDTLLHRKPSVIVAIDGNSGSGKSTLAEMIRRKYDCNVFHMDDFFLTPDLRTAQRFTEPGGNVDYVRFKTEVTEGLKSGTDFQYRVYNCAKQALDRTVSVKPKQLNVVEGSYSMHPTLIEPYDLKIFLGISSEEQSRRILERNGPVLHQRFIQEWIPLENYYFEEMGIREKCDLVMNL